MTRRDDDIAILVAILRPANEPELTEAERQAFREMHTNLTNGERSVLSRKQRVWASETEAKLRPLDAANVARGREVETPWMLRRENLPLRPPGRPT